MMGQEARRCEETHGRIQVVRCVGCWQSDGSRHALKEEFQEYGDGVEVWVGQPRKKEVTRMIPNFPR